MSKRCTGCSGVAAGHSTVPNSPMWMVSGKGCRFTTVAASHPWRCSLYTSSRTSRSRSRSLTPPLRSAPFGASPASNTALKSRPEGVATEVAISFSSRLLPRTQLRSKRVFSDSDPLRHLHQRWAVTAAVPHQRRAAKRRCGLVKEFRRVTVKFPVAAFLLLLRIPDSPPRAPLATAGLPIPLALHRIHRGDQVPLGRIPVHPSADVLVIPHLGVIAAAGNPARQHRAPGRHRAVPLFRRAV